MELFLVTFHCDVVNFLRVGATLSRLRVYGF